MKKIVNKFLVAMLVLTQILICFPTTVFAAELNSDDEIISFEEYYSAMKAEYAKYGHTYEILQKNDDVVLTKTLLEKQIALVDERLSKQNTVLEATLLDNNNIIKANSDKEIGVPSSDRGIQSYDRAVKYFDFVVYDPYFILAYAGFRIEAVIVGNVISGYLNYFESCSCYQYGPYSLLKDWEVVSLDYGISSDQKYANIDAVVRVTFEYTEPNTGFLVGDTLDYECHISIPEWEVWS